MSELRMPDAQSESQAAPLWLNAHVLAECIYCPRAGILAHEEQHGDRGDDLERAPVLGYLPDYSIELIEVELARTWSRIWRSLGCLSALLLTVCIASTLYDGRLWWMLLPLVWFSGRWFLQQLRTVVELSRRLEAAHAAAPQQPDPKSEQQQPVNLWSLLKSGMTSVEYEEPHIDPERHFSGRPWRVLHYGALRIPVFRKRSGGPQVRPQHVARMAAYCDLLERCEGGESPYGVILFGDTYEGLTIPTTAENRALYHRELDRVRTFLAATEAGAASPAPPHSAVCEGCPLGRPRVHLAGRPAPEEQGQRQPPFRTRGLDQRSYHSPCGDRFRWVPPHERAVEKGLL